MSVTPESTRPSQIPRIRALPWSDRRLGLTLFLLVLAVVGAIGYAGHVRHGGFIYDDWQNSAATHYPAKPGLSSVLSHYWDATKYRPFLVLYIPLTHAVFGYHMGVHLAWAFVLGLAMSATLFLLLRELGLGMVAAGAIAILVLIFPGSDATRLWSTASSASLALTMYFVGATLALRGLRRRPPSWRMHAGAVALYALSLLTYEVATGPILASVLIYRIAAPWRVAVKRWLVDLAVAVPILLLVTSNNGREHLGIGKELRHIGTIANQGLTLFSDSAVPFGSPSRGLVTAVVVLVLAVAAVVWARLPRMDRQRRELARWLSVAGGAIVATALGWLAFVPADPYYSPETLGVGNRTNVLAAVGIVALVFATAALVAALVFRRVRRYRVFVTGFAVLVSVVVGVGYVHRLHADVSTWDAAFGLEQNDLNVIKTRLPHPEPGSTIYTFNYPGYIKLGVPVFASFWDLDGAVRITFHDRSLAAYPVIQGVPVECGPLGMRIPISGYHPSPYGRSYLVDISNGRVAQVQSRRACNALLPSFPPGVVVLPPA
jgi:hypothetical protein